MNKLARVSLTHVKLIELILAHNAHNVGLGNICMHQNQLEYNLIFFSPKIYFDNERIFQKCLTYTDC